jgi:hypothetical protein
MRALLLASLALSLPLAAAADEAPIVEHQPVPCMVPGKPMSLCASISDDSKVASARIYFRAAGEKFFSYVDMFFGGINYCGTVPAVVEGKTKAIEYYVQAVDDAYQPQRTSTFQMSVQPEGACDFPPVEKDASRAASMKVYATNQKQGKKLDDAFDGRGVTFVAIAR